MAQTKQDLDNFYTMSDPWGYETNKWDELRKDFIVTTARKYCPLGAKVLDIGCGEGFITKDLPGNLYGIELSNVAAARLPDKIRRIERPLSKYELVVACGVLYEQYDYEHMHKLILKAIATGGYVITCNIWDWEINQLPRDKMVEVKFFPYREYQQVLRVYRWV